MEYEQATEIALSDKQFLEIMFEGDAPRTVIQLPEKRKFVGLEARSWMQHLDTPVKETRYFCVSLFDEAGVRRIENFERQVILVVDDIGEKAPESAFAHFPAPTYKMFTSAASQQWGWKLIDSPAARDRAQLDHFIDHLVDEFFGGKDPGMKGVTRVVRLPNAWNLKESRMLPSGEYPKAKLYEFSPFTRYRLEYLATAVGCDLEKAEAADVSYGMPADWPADAPILKAIERGDIQVFKEGRNPGELLVECPNRAEHTEDNDGHRSGKLYMKADGSGGYKCHHGGCEKFQFPQYLSAVGILEEHEAWRNSFRFKDLLNQIPESPPEATKPTQTNPPAETSLADARPPWRQALDALAGQIDPLANLPFLEQLVLGIIELPTIEQAAATSELKGIMRGSLNGREVDDLLRKTRKERFGDQKRIAAAKNASGVGLGAYTALPGEINYPITGIDGSPLLHPDNVQVLFDHFGITTRANRMTHSIEVNVPGLTLPLEDRENAQLTAIKSIAKASGLPADGIGEYLNYVANQHPHHPVVDMLGGMPDWDGIDRFPKLVELVKTDEPEILAKVLRHWMRQAIVAAFELETTVPRRDVLTFVGPQQIGKTTWFQLLTMQIPGAFRGGHHLDVANKDTISAAISSWICELGEVDSTFKKDIAALKAFISNTEDKLREPYAARATSHLRRTVFCASVNEVEFLKDHTGNTRFKPVEVSDIDLDGMRALLLAGDVQRIWLQMLAEVKSGQPWYFGKEDTADLDHYAERFREHHPIEAALLAVFDFSIPTDRWIEWKSSDIHARLEAAGHKVSLTHLSKGIRPAVKSYTGQAEAKRTTKGSFWLLPPIVDGSNIVDFPPGRSK
jgi:hypothetical protein